MSARTHSTYLNHGRAILRAEANALSKLARSLDSSFSRVVERILVLPKHGRLLTSGVGKAGIIAQKCSATFASIGVPSFFVHPAEALHGDLGRIGSADLLLLFSNSGESAELLALIPHVKRLGTGCILVTCARKSTLGRHSDLVLCLGAQREAGPLGIAPTTSTTAMLALSDALAMTTWQSRKFSRQEFVRFHPGGKLGKTLVDVGQVMRTGKEFCVVSEETVVREVLRRISRTPGRPGAAAVVNKRGRLVGIFTDGNMRRCLQESTAFLDEAVAKVMGKNPKAIAPTESVGCALALLQQYSIDQLLVVNSKGTALGMVDIQDIT